MLWGTVLAQQVQGKKGKHSGRDTAMRALAILERLAGHVSDAAQAAQLTEALLPLASIKTVRWGKSRWRGLPNVAEADS